MTLRTLRWLLVPVLVVPLTWLLFTGFGRDPREVGSPLIGRPAPEWTLATLDGRTLSSGELAGRPYVLNFWASWCIPACVAEHPVLASAHELHGEEVAIVGVLYQDSPADAEAFLARYGDAGYPHLIDEGGRLAIEYGVTGPPETFFVDANGIVRDKQFGPLTDELMADRLGTILTASSR
ncbi:MAG: redoxin family protein [Candidatus Limnocylindria bacterium]